MKKIIDRHSREGLLALIEAGHTFVFLLFYGHKASPDGAVTASCLSQWFPAQFEINGTRYPTAEHYMMAEKARLFGDEELLAQILISGTPKEAKAFGRSVSNFDESTWKANCFPIVDRASRAKFTQNRALADWLVSTTPKVLVEASPFDRIWGIGMGQSNPKAEDPGQWNGQNLLGFAITQVRDEMAAQVR